MVLVRKGSGAMKKYSFVEPLYGCSFVTLEVVMTEEDIIDYYYDAWCGRLRLMNREDQISRENCIEDFVIGHRAVECEDSYVVIYERILPSVLAKWLWIMSCGKRITNGLRRIMNECFRVK